MGMSIETGKAIDRRAHIQQSVTDILTTPVGSRVMRRPYGSDVPRLIDNPNTQRATIQLVSAAALAISRWEPRIKITHINVTHQHHITTLWVEGTDTENGETLKLDGIEIK